MMPNNGQCGNTTLKAGHECLPDQVGGATCQQVAPGSALLGKASCIVTPPSLRWARAAGGQLPDKKRSQSSGRSVRGDLYKQAANWL